MRTVIGEILPLALVVTISPINIIAAILLLFSKKPLLSASCYLVGFTAGVAAILALLVALAGLINAGDRTGGSSWEVTLKIVLGAYLIFAGVRKLRDHHDSSKGESMPRWMEGISSFSPARSLGAGVVVGAFNPKNLVVGLASSVIIASATLTVGQQAGAIAVYVLVAIAGVAAPIVVMASMGSRSTSIIESWRSWLTRNSATVMALLFFIFGVVLISQGIAGR